jgi:hypothetical protein
MVNRTNHIFTTGMLQCTLLVSAGRQAASTATAEKPGTQPQQQHFLEQEFYPGEGRGEDRMIK